MFKTRVERVWANSDEELIKMQCLKGQITPKIKFLDVQCKQISSALGRQKMWTQCKDQVKKS